MNYSITAKPVHLPISLDQPVTRPVTEVSGGAPGFRDATRQQPSPYVYRGEVLETLTDKAYRPKYNLQISPENRRAINSYQMVADEQPIIGRILDGFV